MKVKLLRYRICCGLVMAASAAAYWFLLPLLKPFPFVAWDWPMLAALLLVEFEIFEGIDYFLSGRDFSKPKLCKRMNIVCGSIVLIGVVLMFLNALYHFIVPDLFGLYFLMFFAVLIHQCRVFCRRGRRNSSKAEWIWRQSISLCFILPCFSERQLLFFPWS